MRLHEVEVANEEAVRYEGNKSTRHEPLPDLTQRFLIGFRQHEDELKVREEQKMNYVDNQANYNAIAKGEDGLNV